MKNFAITTFILCLCTWAASSCGEDATIDFPERTTNLPAQEGAQPIRGRVDYLGSPFEPRKLNAPHAGCVSEVRSIYDESIVVTEGRLANVLVYVKKGLEGYTFDYERKEAVVDQVGCVFMPHVVAVQAFQPVRFKNSDAIVHNVNTSSSAQGFVKGMPAKDNSVVRQFRKSELGIKTTCDLHGNMLMWIHVLDHPHFAVTGPDGSFEIPALPPGKYTIAALQERLGEDTQEIEIRAGEPLPELKFSFKP